VQCLFEKPFSYQCFGQEFPVMTFDLSQVTFPSIQVPKIPNELAGNELVAPKPLIYGDASGESLAAAVQIKD